MFLNYVILGVRNNSFLENLTFPIFVLGTIERQNLSLATQTTHAQLMFGQWDA